MLRKCIFEDTQLSTITWAVRGSNQLHKSLRMLLCKPLERNALIKSPLLTRSKAPATSEQYKAMHFFSLKAKIQEHTHTRSAPL